MFQRGHTENKFSLLFHALNFDCKLEGTFHLINEFLFSSFYAGEKRSLNSELWHACAGPLVSLPTVGSRVVYFPQGHSEQVSINTFVSVSIRYD